MPGMSRSISGLDFHQPQDEYSLGLGELTAREWEFFKKAFPDYTKMFKIDIDGTPTPGLFNHDTDAIRLNNAIAWTKRAARYQDASVGMNPSEAQSVQMDMPELRDIDFLGGHGGNPVTMTDLHGPIPTGAAKAYWDKVNRRR